MVDNLYRLHDHCLFTDGGLGDLRFYVPFNSISVISERCFVDNERLYAMEPLLQFERFPPQAGLEPGTARSVGQLLTHAICRTKFQVQYNLYDLFAAKSY